MSQPNPKINNTTPIADLVIQDIEERKKKGLETYGTLLQAFNGRNALLDLQEELYDASIYLKQLEVERNFMITSLIQSAQDGSSIAYKACVKLSLPVYED